MQHAHVPPQHPPQPTTTSQHDVTTVDDEEQAAIAAAAVADHEHESLIIETEPQAAPPPPPPQPQPRPPPPTQAPPTQHQTVPVPVAPAPTAMPISTVVPPPQPPARIIPQPHMNGTIRKSTGNSRRGKQYKCGSCGELGHNTKTCPRRSTPTETTVATSGMTAAIIQPAIGAPNEDMMYSLGNSVSRTTRVQPLKLEAALEAANRRVLAAEASVTNAETNEDFEEATTALDIAVSHLERIGACVKRCAIVAFSLNSPTAQLDISSTPPPPPPPSQKRLRLDHHSTPTNIAPRLDDTVAHEEVEHAVVEHAVGSHPAEMQKAEETYHEVEQC